MRFDVRHLELLLAVERAGSISGAGRLMGLDQPHVTRQLRRIEDQLGYAVFERTGNGTRTTPRGARALARARNAVRAFREIDSDVPVGRSEALHVVHHELDPAPVVAALRTLWPGLVVTTAGCSDPAAGRAELLEGGAAVLLAPRLPDEPWPDPGPLVETEVAADRPVVHVGAGHPLARGGTDELELAELAAEDWITGGSVETERMLRHECRRLGGFTPRTAYRCPEAAVVHELAARGCGVVFGLRSAPWAPGLVARPYRGATTVHRVLLHRPDRISRRAAAVAVAAVRDDHDGRRAPAGTGTSW